MEIWKEHRKKALTTNGKVNMEDVALHWPERLGHLRRISGLVSGLVVLPEVRVEIWDSLNGHGHGSYVPAERLIKLWSGTWLLALTFVHELGHSLMRVGASSWNKWGDDSYLSDPEEIFARAFTQYIALKTGDKTLNLQLEGVREFHWTDEEFEEMINDLTI